LREVIGLCVNFKQMSFPYYKDAEISDDYTTFDFISSGPKGNIHKRIAFRLIEGGNTYNLAFGDVVNGEIDDESISDNKDMPTILATIAYAVEQFLTAYPARIVFFTGNTIARIRLYRMAIGNNLDYLTKTFTIWNIDRYGIIGLFQKTAIQEDSSYKKTL
jgi:hypothetical protein